MSDIDQMAQRNLFKQSTHDLERQGSRVAGISTKSKFPPYFWVPV